MIDDTDILNRVVSMLRAGDDPRSVERRLREWGISTQRAKRAIHDAKLAIDGIDRKRAYD